MKVGGKRLGDGVESSQTFAQAVVKLGRIVATHLTVGVSDGNSLMFEPKKMC